MKITVKSWFKSGSPWVWMNAGAVAISLVMVIGLLSLIAARGLGHFWPSSIMVADYAVPGQTQYQVMGQLADSEEIPTQRLLDAGMTGLNEEEELVTRDLLKVGNRDVSGSDFAWVVKPWLKNVDYPEDAIALERREWGNFYGFLKEVREQGKVTATGTESWEALNASMDRALAIHDDIYQIEKGDIGTINNKMERLRLKQRGLELRDKATPQALADIASDRAQLEAEYKVLEQQLGELYVAFTRDSVLAETVDGKQVEINVSKIVRAYQPNAMGTLGKVGFYGSKIWEFVADDPREANTEGGIFPAIFGTVMMVLIMSVIVTPFGVIAAVYLREYASQGTVTRIIRIAVNNLAGVPSIVYGVFGLGFFVYFLGSHMDAALFPEALPSPTFGTPGLLWASITLALLTLPVVIVATEEGLSRIPSSVREGSLALGATKAETLWRVVLPMASPAMMTGLILAVARAAGEVAPLMLVGVVKLAPSLPLDGNYPFLHLDQKFMHLGFHIYDVGFQSPNVEAARPLVYATALLLVVVIAVLNLSAVAIRNHLREKYKSLEV